MDATQADRSGSLNPPASHSTPSSTPSTSAAGSALAGNLLLLLALLGFVASTWLVGWRQGLLWCVGVGLGYALAAGSFGFTTGWRVWITHRDPTGMLAQFFAIAVCMVLSVPLLAAHPELQGADGPLSWSLVIGSFVFGASMQIADGCGSGTLYKAGLGHPVSLLVLPAFVMGSFAGSAQLPGWLALGSLPAVSLVQHLGAAATLALQLGVLGVLAALLWRLRDPHSPRRWKGRRVWIAGAALGLLGAANLVVAGQPWGIVYGLGLWGAKIVQALGVNLSHNAFYGLPVQQAQLHASVLADNTSMTDLGMLFGALMAAQRARRLSPRISLPLRGWVASVVAGLLMGYSSRLAFGCNVGAYFSGIATGSLHGWVWFACAFAGSLLGVRLRSRLGVGGRP